ncbi:MAG: ATP-binding protein [Lachnospiraceae bacterium]|nr:ATP-binding protein [Lachnospiraceae bacterium]
MFVNRKKEIKDLENLYANDQNNVAILYGRFGIGKTELVKKFIADKPFVYYRASELSSREQSFACSIALTGNEAPLSLYDSLAYAIRKNMRPEKKIVVVLDEFQSLVDFRLEESVVKILSAFKGIEHVMFLLVSSSVRWIENTLVDDAPYIAKLTSAFIKVRDFSFTQMVSRLDKLETRDVIVASAILGGVPRYLDYWRQEKTPEENIMSMFLTKNSVFLNEAEFFLKQELRELSAYNAILSALAGGRIKLNDLYSRTGFSRAKISVYIKNLTELDVVEKVFSYDEGDSTNVQKGLYRIKDNFLRFYYRFIYPNMTLIELSKGKEVYETKIAPYLDEFMREAYRDVSFEYLKLTSEGKGRVLDNYETWYGKNGIIDIVARDNNGKVIVGICDLKSEKTKTTVIDALEELLNISGIAANEIHFFSNHGFTQDFINAAKEKKYGFVSIDEL